MLAITRLWILALAFAFLQASTLHADAAEKTASQEAVPTSDREALDDHEDGEHDKSKDKNKAAKKAKKAKKKAPQPEEEELPEEPEGDEEF